MCNTFQPGMFVVIGDLIVDEFEVGSVTRISPEAPVPVLDFKNRKRSPGGAANVAMNLAGLGNHVEMVGRVGNDEAGLWLKKALLGKGIGIAGVVTDMHQSTTRKVRFATSQQTILRVDYEQTDPIDASISKQMVSSVEQTLSKHKVDGVLVSDYNKGMLVNDSEGDGIAALIRKISKMPLLCGVDTKKTGPSLHLFADFDFIKPNIMELSKAVDMKVDSTLMLQEACKKYRKLSRAKSVLVTLGADGIYHYNGSEGMHIPAIEASVYDVTGAGDTVFAVMMYALCNGAEWAEAMHLANLAASIVIGQRGTQPISLSELNRGVEWIANTQPEHFIACRGKEKD